jgi:putative FmdB family regulatory protein
MPIYEYACDDCGERYERIVINKTTAITCPKCESGNKTVQLSVFAAPASGTRASNDSANTLPMSGGCACTPSSCGCR